MIRNHKDKIKEHVSKNEEETKFKKTEQQVENQIVALLKISEKNDSFTEEEIEDLVTITQGISHLLKI